jgi:AcrR family transcriptional regulator
MRAATKSRPRTKPPEERRDELMNAAQRLFLEHGVGPTTIERITSGAKVAKGTFYLYFSSKEDLLAAIGERFAQELLGKITAAIGEKTERDWRGRLAAWARAAVSGYLDAMRLHDIVFHEFRPPTREGAVDNIVVDHLADLLEAGTVAGAWSIDDPRLAAVFLFSGLHGVADDVHIKGKRSNRKRLADKLERLCFRAVGLATG